MSAAMLGVGIWAVNLHALPADIFVPARVATAYGFAGSAGALGGFLFNSLVGYFSQRSNYTGVFAVLVALQPLGLAGLWLLVRRGTTEGLKTS
jgi:nitrate/nitrite transporter NarK